MASTVLACMAFCCCLCSLVYGQPGKDNAGEIAKLKQLYQSEVNDSLKLDYFTKIGQLYRFINLDTSKHLLHQAIAAHKRNRVNPSSHAFAYNVIADIYNLEKNIDSARYYYEEAYQLFLDDRHSMAFLAIAAPYGHFLIRNHEIERGVKLFEEAISIAKKNNDYHNLSFLYGNLGHTLHRELNDHEAAKDMYLQGMESGKKMVDEFNYERLISGICVGLSNIFLEEGQLDSTIVFALKAVEYGNKSGLYQKVVVAYNNLCMSYIRTGDYGTAKRYNQLAAKLNGQVHDLDAIITTNVHGQVLDLRLGNYRQCIEKGKSILGTHEGHIAVKSKAEVYNYLCECYLLTGASKQAKDAKDSLVFLTQRSLDLKHKELLNRIYNEYQVKEKEAENRLLKLKQEAVGKRLQVQRLAALGLVFALIFAIAWAVSVYRSNLRRKKYNALLEAEVEAKTKELKQANESLEQSNYELRTLNYIASHDIKEPIKNIGSFAGLIQKKLPDETREAYGEYFQVIINSAKQLYNLIEDFANYISLSKHTRLNLGRTDLNEVVKGIQADLLIIGKYRNGTVVNQGLPVIYANQSALYVILKNLVENGLKFNTSTVPEVVISWQVKNGHGCIVVKDNGIGIPEIHQDKVFETFKRLHNRTDYEGNGIGLSMVKLLVSKMDGEITMESQANVGTTFTIAFPSLELVSGKAKDLAQAAAG